MSIIIPIFIVVDLLFFVIFEYILMKIELKKREKVKQDKNSSEVD